MGTDGAAPCGVGDRWGVGLGWLEIGVRLTATERRPLRGGRWCAGLARVLGGWALQLDYKSSLPGGGGLALG